MKLLARQHVDDVERLVGNRVVFPIGVPVRMAASAAVDALEARLRLCDAIYAQCKQLKSVG